MLACVCAGRGGHREPGGGGAPLGLGLLRWAARASLAAWAWRGPSGVWPSSACASGRKALHCAAAATPALRSRLQLHVPLCGGGAFLALRLVAGGVASKKVAFVVPADALPRAAYRALALACGPEPRPVHPGWARDIALTTGTLQ